MNYLIELCGIFNPGFIASMGVVAIFFILYNTLSQLNKNKKITSGYNLSEYDKITGKICGYESKTEKRIVKKDGKTQQVDVEILLPVINYIYDNEERTITYNIPFYKQINSNIGYEVAVYVDKHTQVPVIKYDDIYCLETRNALITAYVIASIIGIITIAAIVLSCISNLS